MRYKSLNPNWVKLYYYVITLFISFLRWSEATVNSNIEIWGPGLFPDKIIVPARYFYLKNNHINESSYHSDLKDNIKISISGNSPISGAGTCRVWHSILDRKDGSFIIRYRVYNTCMNFRISVQYKNEVVGKSPYYFEGPIYPEDCDCPVLPEQWMTNMNCRNEYNQIIADLKPFPRIDLNEILPEVEKRYDRPASVSLCHYAIVANKIYRKCYGKHVGFNMFSDAILLSLSRKYILADTSFFMNLGDWPLSRQNMPPLPIISWCGSNDTFDIVLPTYDITESTLESMRRVTLDMLSVQGNIEDSWKTKIPKGFFRGRDSRKERLELIEIGRKYPSLFNVSLTNYFFFRDEEQVYGKTPAISFYKFFDYKYQISIDGTVAAYRMPYLLAGNSLVFKQDSPYYEHFYRDLQPNVHFIPFKRDLSDLTAKIKWAIKNDDEAWTISRQGSEYARDNLMPVDIFCYHARVLEEYSKRIVSPIKIYPGMEEVSQSEDIKNCDCMIQSNSRIQNSKIEL